MNAAEPPAPLPVRVTEPEPRTRVTVNLTGSLTRPVRVIGGVTHFTVAGTERLAVDGGWQEYPFYVQARAKSDCAETLAGVPGGALVSLQGQLWTVPPEGQGGRARPYVRTERVSCTATPIPERFLRPDRANGLRLSWGTNSLAFVGRVRQAVETDWSRGLEHVRTRFELGDVEDGGPFQLTGRGSVAHAVTGVLPGTRLSGVGRLRNNASTDGMIEALGLQLGAGT